MTIDSFRALRSFVTTNWYAIQDQELSYIVECYWGPVFHYLLRKGYAEADAEDLTQEFFTDSLNGNRFSKADPARGRFRAFLLSSLDNFLANVHRAAKAQKRRPSGGVVSIEAMADSGSLHYEPTDLLTPAAAFNRAWAAELIARVLGALETECRSKEKEDFFEAFRLCIIEPAMDGATAPARSELAARYRTTEKEVSNRLITTRRAYQRLLRAEIARYAVSEAEVDAEMRDLIREVGSR